jgi:hypothetical protein
MANTAEVDWLSTGEWATSAILFIINEIKGIKEKW